MKIVISAKEDSSESLLDPRFGRCSFFHHYDTDTKDIKVIKNEAINLSGGAGIKAANRMVDENVDVVITGNLGPNAERVLSASNIKVYTSSIKKITDVINDYNDDKLEVFKGVR